MNFLTITIFSQKKLNTYSVESSCECLPRVGSFLANPGLSKEQLVPSCVVRTFTMVDSFIELLALHPINPLNETMFSQRKLNTDGVESPCECLPGVGSFLANPGLSKKTTRTELHHENIHGGRFVHWNIGIKPAALGRYNIRNYGFIHGNADIISTTLCGYNIRHGGFIHCF